MTERVRKAEEFLRQKLAESPFFMKHPEKGDYRPVLKVKGERNHEFTQ